MLFIRTSEIPELTCVFDYALSGSFNQLIDNVDVSKLYYVCCMEAGAGLASTISITNATTLAMYESLRAGVARFFIVQPTGTSFNITGSTGGRYAYTTVWRVDDYV